MNNLESKFKQALENHEMDYDPKAWDSFKQKLDAKDVAQPNGGSNTLAKLGIAASVAGILSFGAYFLFFNGGESTKTKSTDTERQADVIENPENKSKVDLVEEHSADVNHDHSNNNVNDIQVDESLTKKDLIENDLFNVEDKSKSDDFKKEDDLFAFEDDVKKVENGSKNGDGVVNPSDIQNIHLNPNFSMEPVSGCEGMECVFKPKQKDVEGVEYVWDFGDGKVSKERTPTHTFNKAGNYSVKLTLNYEISNQFVSEHSQEYLTVNAKPSIAFEIEQNSSSSAIPEYEFVNRTDQAISWAWNFGDNSNSTKKSPVHTYRKKGSYKVTLTAENAFGCTSSLTKRVTVDNDFNLLAPTAFTPDGDGLNDNFIPRALEIMNAEFTMSIFHKNGQLYYETNQVSRPWDGRYMMDNQNAPGGAYVWVVQVKNKDGETEVYKGSVTLLRQ